MCKNNKIYNSLHSFSSTAAKIWNSLPNALGTTCDINVLKILNYPTVSPPFSNLPFKIPTKGGGPGDISLVKVCSNGCATYIIHEIIAKNNLNIVNLMQNL